MHAGTPIEYLVRSQIQDIHQKRSDKCIVSCCCVIFRFWHGSFYDAMSHTDLLPLPVETFPWDQFCCQPAITEA